MRRYRQSATAFLAAVIAVSLLSCAGEEISSEKPLLPTSVADKDAVNLLIIVSDDLGYGDVGFNGNTVVKTPNMDQLASDGMSFHSAYVPASMCSPSRAALYTGLYPYRNGMSRNHYEAREGVKSLPHYLTALGYRTALAGKSHVRPFSVFPFERLERSPEAVAEYIQAQNGVPFAMVIAQHHPHIPWLPNTDYDVDAISLPARLVDTAETREAMARYYSSVTAADKELGVYLELLETLGLEENTVVVYLSAHGPQFPFAKFSNYDAGLKVPMIVRWPAAVKGGSHSNALVSSTDILPTLIELAGGTVADDFDGKSLLPLLRGELETHHAAVYGVHSTLGLNIPDIKPYGIRTLRTERYRYIRNLHADNLPRSLLTEPRPINYPAASCGELNPQRLKGSLMYLFQFGIWIPPGLPTYWKSWLERSKQDQSAADVVNSYFNRPAEELYGAVCRTGQMGANGRLATVY